MTLTGRLRVQRNYDGASKFEFWKNLKKGTILKIQTTIGPWSRSYSPNVVFSYKENGQEFSFKCKWGNAAVYLRTLNRV